MRAFGRPGWTAVLCVLLAGGLHPALRADRLPAGATIVVALSLLLAASLAARAREGIAALLTALGAATLLLAAGYDALRGHAGTLSLVPGQATRVFEERGPRGKPLGLRPLGFDLTLERIGPAGAGALWARAGVGAGTRAQVTGARAATLGAFRIGAPQAAASGNAALLRLRISQAGETREAELVPGETARAGDLQIDLERYFPDFALDEKGQPFSRSAEARNPAALLRVRRGGSAWRVFAIQALPGIHQQEGLDRSFALVSVEPVVALTLTVAREPAAPLAALGLLLVALGLARGLGGR